MTDQRISDQPKTLSAANPETGDTAMLRDALKEALALFSKGHALDNFNWAASHLTADNIRELNKLPGTLRAALTILRKTEQAR